MAGEVYRDLEPEQLRSEQKKQERDVATGWTLLGARSCSVEIGVCRWLTGRHAVWNGNGVEELPKGVNMTIRYFVFSYDA